MESCLHIILNETFKSWFFNAPKLDIYMAQKMHASTEKPKSIKLKFKYRVLQRNFLFQLDLMKQAIKMKYNLILKLYSTTWEI